MVWRCEARRHSAGMVRVAQDRIKIDYRIKRAAGPNPFVNRLPNRFLGFRVVARNVDAFKRSDRGSNQLDPVSVSARNQLAVAVNQVLGTASIGWIGEVALVELCAGEADVIDPFEQHDMSYARQRQHIAVEPGQPAGTETFADVEAVAQQPVTSYALVDYCNVRASVGRSQATDEIVRPIVVGIDRGSIAISNRVAKCHDQALGRLSGHKHSGDQD